MSKHYAITSSQKQNFFNQQKKKFCDPAGGYCSMIAFALSLFNDSFFALSLQYFNPGLEEARILPALDQSAQARNTGILG
jgi:hypothetical protein